MPELSTIQRDPRYATNAPVEVLHPKAGWQRLQLENISVGGAFVRSLSPVPLGARLQVRIPAARGFEGGARAVHTIDQAAAARKSHPPGAGLHFEALNPAARDRLKEFVEAVAMAASWPQLQTTLEVPRPSRDQAGLVRTVAHRVGPCTIEVRAGSRAELLDLWARELSQGRLFVHFEDPLPLRSRLELWLRAAHGVFGLQVEVVHQLAFEPVRRPAYGVGLQLTDFTAVRRSLEEFTRGAGERALTQQPTPTAPLADVLAKVKLLFDGLERGQPRQALGLPPDARSEDERARLAELRALFSRAQAGASAPQLARLDAAQRALTRLEREHAQREQSLHSDLALQKPPDPAPPPRAVAPSVAPVTQQPAVVEQPQREAEVLISHAEVFVVAGMRGRAVEAVRQALEHECDEALLQRAMAVCVRAQDFTRAVAIGQTIVRKNPRHAHAWRSLVDVYEASRHYVLAVRAAEALQRLLPRDRELAARLARLRIASRS